jgi:2-oxoglutarate dehydrogenase E1 component
MPESTNPKFGINSWLEDELYEQYLHDKGNVDESWKAVFDKSNGGAPPAPSTAVQRQPSPNGATPAPVVTTPPVSTAVAIPQHHSIAGEQLVPLRGAAARIAENMTASLSIPTATSQRVIAVKVIEENRRILNEHRSLLGKGKISYTHLIAWAIVKSVGANPTLNHAYAMMDNEGLRAVRTQINIGIAPDQHRNRCRRGRQGWHSISKGSEHQERRIAHLRAIPRRLRRHRRTRSQRQTDDPRL